MLQNIAEVLQSTMLISLLLMIIISTYLTVPGQPSPRFHVEAWLPFRIYFFVRRKSESFD